MCQQLQPAKDVKRKKHSNLVLQPNENQLKSLKRLTSVLCIVVEKYKNLSQGCQTFSSMLFTPLLFIHIARENKADRFSLVGFISYNFLIRDEDNNNKIARRDF